MAINTVQFGASNGASEICLLILHGTEVAFALLTQLPQVRFSAFPKIFLTEISIHVVEFHRRLALH